MPSALGRLFGDESGLLGESVDPDDVEVLGRVIVSEADGQTRAEQTAVAWATLNKAHARGQRVSEALRGRGTQGTGGRYASTRQSATPAARELARQILAGEIPDPTGGATSFFEPDQQDRLYAEGRSGYKHDAAGLRALWLASGDVLVAKIGRWEFYKGGSSRKRSGASSPLTPLLAGVAVAAGVVVLLRRADR